MALILEDICLSLSKKKILKHINLKVEKGEFISLLGPSGCGKTSLLKTIAGLVEEDQGSIYLNGRLANNLAPHKRKAVIVFQDFRLFPHMTVGENICFPMKLLGYSKKDSIDEMLKILKKIGLSGFENRSVTSLSGGQMQRVALGRALAAKPSLLLLDEPFSSLDLNLRESMRELVLELHKEYKMTTILVTHDQAEAMAMSDRIAFMSEGSIIQYDRPEKIFNQPVNRTVADYFSPGFYLKGKVVDHVFISDLFTFPLEIDNGNYLCLIRPYSFNITKDLGGEFLILDKIYQGSYSLLKIGHKDMDFILESKVSNPNKLNLGDHLKLELKKEELIIFQR